MKKYNKNLASIFAILLAINNEIVFAKLTSSLNTKTKDTNSYQPYLQFGGTGFFHTKESSAAAIVDMFIPIWQRDLTDLVFSDLRIYDRSGAPFEGNVHLGYRHLFTDSQQLLGFYGALDRKKTEFSSYFTQLTFGGEYWYKKWFIGANFYKPIGRTTRLINEEIIDVNINTNDHIVYDVNLVINAYNVAAKYGTDAEVGYEFIDGLVGYAGGYYFNAKQMSVVCGPKARLAYDWSLDNGRILGIFDKVGLEAGIQHDKPRGTFYYLSANARIGWLFERKAELKGISRHMVDSIRRDVDIVYEAKSNQKQENYKIKLLNNDNNSSGGGGSGNFNSIDEAYNFLTNGRNVKSSIKEKIYAHLERPSNPDQFNNKDDQKDNTDKRDEQSNQDQQKKDADELVLKRITKDDQQDNTDKRDEQDNTDKRDKQSNQDQQKKDTDKNDAPQQPTQPVVNAPHGASESMRDSSQGIVNAIHGASEIVGNAGTVVFKAMPQSAQNFGNIIHSASESVGNAGPVVFKAMPQSAQNFGNIIHSASEGLARVLEMLEQ